MAAILELWVGEFSKIKEKVSIPLKPFFSKAKQTTTEQNNKESVDVPSRNSSSRVSSTMSEETVCLLMDRFVPCDPIINESKEKKLKIINVNMEVKVIFV
ncbi:hypothetical protein RYX36_036489 [Vicia faba]